MHHMPACNMQQPADQERARERNREGAKSVTMLHMHDMSGMTDTLPRHKSCDLVPITLTEHMCDHVGP